MAFVKEKMRLFADFFCWEHYLILFLEVTPNWFYGPGQFVFPKIFNGFTYHYFGRQTAPMQMNFIYNCKMAFVKEKMRLFADFFCWEHYLILFLEVTPNWFYGPGQFVFPKIFNGFTYHYFGRQTAPMQMNFIYNRNIPFSHKCTTLRKYSPILIKKYRLFTTDGHRLSCGRRS